jgi:hypothetical protein
MVVKNIEWSFLSNWYLLLLLVENIKYSSYLPIGQIVESERGNKQ